MFSFLSKTLVSSFAVLIASWLLSGVHIHNTGTVIMVAIVLGLLNSFIKPVLIVLTLPITVFTLGLFLLFINVLMVKWASQIVDGFKVDGWFTALAFSFIVSTITSLIETLIKSQEQEKD